MNVSLFAAAMTAGLLGGLHCLSMCGGVASALKVGRQRDAAAARKIIPIVDINSTAAIPLQQSRWLVGAYHIGRIATYILLGFLVATFSKQLQFLIAHVSWLQMTLFLFVQVTLIVVGLKLLLGMQMQKFLAPLEAKAALIWQHTSPITRKLLPADRIWRNLLLGMIWGAVPCSLVYSVLLLAMLANDPWQGALVMLLFGLGTLPHWLLGMHWLRQLVQSRFRKLMGGLILLAGFWGLAHATTMSSNGLWCL